MGKYGTIAILALLAVIGVMLFLLMKASRLQSQMVSAIGVKTGAFGETKKQLPKGKKTGRTDRDDDEDEYEEGGEEETKTNEPKKIKLKAIHKNIISLFEDGIPKTTGEIKKLYKKFHSDKVDDVKLNNSIWNLEPSHTLMVEMVGKVNYWGLPSWFDEEGYFLEEYADKIPGASKELDNTEQAQSITK